MRGAVLNCIWHFAPDACSAIPSDLIWKTRLVMGSCNQRQFLTCYKGASLPGGS